MTLPTQAELLTIVSHRYPHLDAAKQAALVHSAVRVLAEPQWVRIPITPTMAVKMASHRSKRKSF